MSKILLIDFSWLWNRSLYAFKDLSFEVDGETYPTGGIYGVLKFVQSSKNWGFDKKIFCLDGTSQMRRELFPEYKAQREHDEFRSQARKLNPSLFSILTYSGFDILLNRNYEADDIIASKALEEVKAGNEVTVYTSDKDLMQLMPYGVKVANKVDEGKLVYATPEYFEEKVGVPPELGRFFRAFKGDPSDNIPSAAPRVQTKILAPMAQQIKSLVESGSLLGYAYDAVYAHNSGTMTEKAKNAFNKQQYLTNFALMDLTQYWHNPIEVPSIMNENKVTESDFLAILDKLGMKEYKTFYLDTLAAVGSF